MLLQMLVRAYEHTSSAASYRKVSRDPAVRLCRLRRSALATCLH